MSGDCIYSFDKLCIFSLILSLYQITFAIQCECVLSKQEHFPQAELDSFYYVMNMVIKSSENLLDVFWKLGSEAENMIKVMHKYFYTLNVGGKWRRNIFCTIYM